MWLMIDTFFNWNFLLSITTRLVVCLFCSMVACGPNIRVIIGVNPYLEFEHPSIYKSKTHDIDKSDNSILEK